MLYRIVREAGLRDYVIRMMGSYYRGADYETDFGRINDKIGTTLEQFVHLYDYFDKAINEITAKKNDPKVIAIFNKAHIKAENEVQKLTKKQLIKTGLNKENYVKYRETVIAIQMYNGEYQEADDSSELMARR